MKRNQTISLSCHHHKIPTTFKGIIVYLLSIHTMAHALVHVVSLLPILLGVTGITHDHHLGESIIQSIILNFILHGVMALMVVKYQKGHTR